MESEYGCLPAFDIKLRGLYNMPQFRAENGGNRIKRTLTWAVIKFPPYTTATRAFRLVRPQNPGSDRKLRCMNRMTREHNLPIATSNIDLTWYCGRATPATISQQAFNLSAAWGKLRYRSPCSSTMICEVHWQVQMVVIGTTAIWSLGCFAQG